MSELRALCGLWRRAGFGASPQELRRSLRQGYDATMDELVRYDEDVDGLAAPPIALTFPLGATLTILQIASVIRWWLNQMIDSRTPLREKLTLFWHGHFTTSADPVFSAGLLLRQNQLLRRHAAGRFGDLLRAVARDPAMLVYLDGVNNRKAHPNENFARELLELFTLGVGHYTERDVREAARAFTGWTLSLPDVGFRFDDEQHDDGVKHFLGHRGRLDGDDVLDILARHPQTARHVTARLYRYFTDEAPPAAEQERLAGVFQQHHGTIRAVVDALLRGAAFRDSLQRRAAWRSPIEYVVAALRGLQGHFRDLAWIDPTRIMGQVPFLPPSVKGWDGGAAWINTSSLLERVNYAHLLVGSSPQALGDPLAGARGTQAARRLTWLLGMADASAATRQALADAWERTRDAAAVLELALAAPDFQVR